MKITEKITLLESTMGAYAYLVMGEEPVLIDTGFAWQGKALLAELARLGVNPADIKHILLTHSDLDHIGNAAMLQRVTGAALWASAADRPYILGEKKRPGFKRFLPYLFRVKTPKEVAVFAEGGSVAGIRVIPTPGHTPGHVCLLYDGVLFAGDLVKNEDGRLIPYPKGWNWDNELHLKSIQAAEAWDFKWVCPAHGRPLQTNKLL